MPINNASVMYRIWKYIPLIAILIYNPFVLRDDYIGVPISTTIYLILFIVLVGLNIKFKLRNVHLLIAISGAVFFYLNYNVIYNYKYFFSTLNDFCIVSFSVLVCSQFYDWVIFNKFYKLWITFLYVIAIMAIISYALYFFQLIPFYHTNLGGYDVFYNNIFLGRMHTGPFFRRASLYFSEPSYLGFFVGINIFFIAQTKYPKKKLLITALVLAGALSGSMTLLFGFLAVIVFQLIFKNLFSVRVSRRSGVYFISFILISFYYTAFKDQLFEVLDFGSRLDRDMRAIRSIDILSKSSIPQLLFGYGSTYIAKVDFLGESNSYLRLAVENGLLMLTGVLVFLYNSLKKNPELMLFMLISLHSIVLFLTPFVIIYTLFIYYYYYHENYYYYHEKQLYSNVDKS